MENGFNLLDVLKWLWSNIPFVFMILTTGTFFTLIVAITRFIRNVKEGIKEMATPLGMFVALILMIIIFVVYVMIRSTIKPLM